MRTRKTVTVVLAIVLFTAGGAARAAIILHEPFDYGASDKSIDGLGGSETGFLASETWDENEADADYVPAGLTFSDLETTGGKLNYASDNNQQTIGRNIDVSQTGQIWGSYLWRPISNTQNSHVNGIMLNNALGGTDNNSEFFSAGLGYNAGDKGEVRLNGGNKGSAQAGSVSQTDGNTHLVLYTVTNLGSSPGAMTQWILTADQFDTFKVGGLTETELNTATLGSAAGEVLQRASRSGVGAGAAMTASDYLLVFQHGTTEADYDEIRMSDTSLNEVVPTGVAPPPPPQEVFFIGVDNGNNSDFDNEGQADDHYYWEDGDYSTLGTGGGVWSEGRPEIWKDDAGPEGFERALTGGDNNTYIYFQLDTLEAADDAQFTFVSDFVQNNGTHNVDFYIMNGNLFHTETGIGTATVVKTFTGAEVGAQVGSNVIEIRRTNAGGGWIQFDYLSLDVVPGTVVIPEPATMLAVFAAVAGLGGYVRKRRRIVMRGIKKVAVLLMVVLLAAGGAARAATVVEVETRLHSDAGMNISQPVNPFSTVPNLSAADFAETNPVAISVVKGTAFTASGPPSKLIDGLWSWDGDRDAPGQTLFSNDASFAFQYDLRQVVTVDQINTYSRHVGNRTPQVYTVYGSAAETPPTTNGDPTGWTAIATVDTRTGNTPDDTGGSYDGIAGVGIRDSGAGSLGGYRHLLFDTTKPGAGTFYAEVDVVGTGTGPSATMQDFDGGGTASTTRQLDSAPGPAVLAGGPTGNYMRLINDGVNNNRNAVAFDQAPDGVNPSGSISVDFDVRFTDASGLPADGGSMLLIPTSTYGALGDGWGGGGSAEEPNLAGAFAIGMDLHPAEGPQNVNDISVHWNGSEIANVRMNNADVNLDAGVFHRVHAELVEGVGAGGDVAVTVTITPDIHGVPGTPYTPIDNVTMTGMHSFADYRVEFTGRTGGRNVSMDLDNIQVAAGAPLGGTAAFADFSDVSQWVFNGTATQVGDRIRLTEDAGSQGGSAYYVPRLRLDDGNAFNAEFSFVIDQPRDGNNAADGLALVIHDDPRGWSALGGLGGAIGQDNITPRLAIIVEDYQTPELQIRTSTGDGNTQVNLDTSYVDGIRNGAEWFVWADYDGTTDLLEVFLSDTNIKPGAATLSTTIDLVSLFNGEDELIVGFTGATGGAYAEHDILSMRFNGAPSVIIPEPATMLAVFAAVAGLGGYVRKRRRAAN